ncbi:sodium-independent anion transporter [Rhodoblastus sphagnicola]|uniref:Sodium-independent anion transporter n=2 Tax=Rhodoblastus sphagnicola TaxID=333368 RepID=A0A2S6MUC3_9HYPH|nr:sodium-independent anion transporter [Rhodoblastus sphagnicola]
MGNSRLVFGALRGAALTWRADLLAGLTLAAIAAPEQMATARLGGFAPSIGFYAFIAGALGFALLGANRQMSVGADSTITPIFAASLALIAPVGGPQYAALAALLALLVGLFMSGAGLFRAGWVANLLSTPVLTGFLAGIAVHIALSQLPALLGLPAGSGDTLQRVAQIAAQIGEIKALALSVGLVCLVSILVIETYAPRLPGALLAVGGATLGALLLKVDPSALPVIGAFPVEWPQLAAPEASVEQVFKLVGLAVILTLVIMVQSAATSRAYPGSSGEEPDINRDFLGVGAGGVLAGLFGAFPVNASPPRTAMVAASGGKTQISGLTAALALGLLAAFGENFLSHAPETSLAATLLFVAGRIFRLGDMRDICRRSRPEFLLMAITTAAVVLLPVQTGVTLAIILSLIHGAWATTQTDLQTLERLPGETVWWPRNPLVEGETLAGVAVVSFQAPLSFLNADRCRLQLQRAAEQPQMRLIVLEASAVVSIDYTAARALAAAIDHCHARGCDFAIARLESVRAQAAMKTFGVLDALGATDSIGERLFYSVDDALRRLGAQAFVRTGAAADGNVS